MNKLDNKGFTLVELIGVMVILIVIAMIAVPNISSSVERTKAKKNNEISKSLEYATELYLSENKDKRTDFYKASGSCYISIDSLIKERYIMTDELGSSSYKYIVYESGKYEGKTAKSGKTEC